MAGNLFSFVVSWRQEAGDSGEGAIQSPLPAIRPAPLLTPILVSSFQFTGIFSKPILVYFFFLMTYLIYPCLPDFFCRSEGCEGTGATAALHKIHNNV